MTRPSSSSFQARSSDIGACCADAAPASMSRSHGQSRTSHRAIPACLPFFVWLAQAWPISAPDLYRFRRDGLAHLRYATAYIRSRNIMSRRVKKPLQPEGRSPEGRAALSGLARPSGRGASSGRQAAARFAASAPRAPKPSSCRSPQKVAAEPPPLPTKVQTVVVTADENNMRVDRFLEARFPGLSFSHIQRIVRKGELRVNGKRADSKDRLEEGQSVRIPPLKLDTPKVAGELSEAAQQDAAGAQGHDPLRGRRRHGAEQARGAGGAGRLRHHAQRRRHAGSDARRQGPEAAAGAPARPGNLGLPA